VNPTLVVNTLYVLWDLCGLGKDTVFTSETDCVYEVWAVVEETDIE
jgi:hypothetical protein